MVIKAPPWPLRLRPRVSVVIPCYNYGRFLGECVHSVLGQDGVDVDVIIVDDASPDGSVAVARQLAKDEPRVRVIEHEVNQGHIATYNEGLAAADGEYVMLLSADDLVTAGSLARSTALLQANPDVGLVYGFTRPFVDEPPPPRTTVRSWSIWSGPEWLDLVCRRVRNPIYTPEVVMRNTTMRDLVGYDARVPHAADFLLWLRAATRGSVGRVNGVDTAYYRVHGNNMHVERYAGVLLDVEERHLALEILFTDDGDRIPATVELRAAANRALAIEALTVAGRTHQQKLPSEISQEEADVLERLVAYAEAICPESRNSRLRRSYDGYVARARGGKGPLVPPRLAALRDRAVVHARWRRWRRSGVDGVVSSL